MSDDRAEQWRTTLLGVGALVKFIFIVFLVVGMLPIMFLVMTTGWLLCCTIIFIPIGVPVAGAGLAGMVGTWQWVKALSQPVGGVE